MLNRDLFSTLLCVFAVHLFFDKKILLSHVFVTVFFKLQVIILLQIADIFHIV